MTQISDIDIMKYNSIQLEMIRRGFTLPTSIEIAFCEEYNISFNANKAALKAGYSHIDANEQSYNLLRQFNTVFYMCELAKETRDRKKINVQWVIDKAVLLYDKSMADTPIVDGMGNKTGVYKFDSSGAAKALLIISKHVESDGFNGEFKQINSGTNDNSVVMWGGTVNE